METLTGRAKWDYLLWARQRSRGRSKQRLFHYIPEASGGEMTKHERFYLTCPCSPEAEEHGLGLDGWQINSFHRHRRRQAFLWTNSERVNHIILRSCSDELRKRTDRRRLNGARGVGGTLLRDLRSLSVSNLQYFPFGRGPGEKQRCEF